MKPKQTICERAYALRRAAEDLERRIINAETMKHAEPMSAIYRRLRDNVGEVELAMRALRTTVQSRKRAAAKVCLHEGAGNEIESYHYAGPGQTGVIKTGMWRCRFCDEKTPVSPKMAAPQAVQG